MFKHIFYLGLQLAFVIWLKFKQCSILFFVGINLELSHWLVVYRRIVRRISRFNIKRPQCTVTNDSVCISKATLFKPINRSRNSLISCSVPTVIRCNEYEINHINYTFTILIIHSSSGVGIKTIDHTKTTKKSLLMQLPTKHDTAWQK